MKPNTFFALVFIGQLILLSIIAVELYFAVVVLFSI